MRARLDLLICFAMAGAAATGCMRDNPAFEDEETGGDPETAADAGHDLPTETSDDSSSSCELAGGMDIEIKVPQPCGETNDMLGLYEHWFLVTAAAGSTWTVQFCTADCMECEPVAGELLLDPLPVAQLAAPNTCLLMKGRRLGSGDDCSYHAISIQDMSNNGAMLVLARRTELLELPPIDSSTGLFGWQPTLVIDQQCDCALSPDACCGSEPATLYAYQVEGSEPIPVGSMQPVTIGGRSYDFWAFDAYKPGECNATTSVSWALVGAN